MFIYDINNLSSTSLRGVTFFQNAQN